MKNALGIACVYIASIVGAGFASGQEILTFFSVHGMRGIIGILISGILFGVCGASVLYRVYKTSITSFDIYITTISGKCVGAFCNTMAFTYMVVIFCVMAVGSGALLEQQTGIDRVWGVLGMLFLCALVFAFDVKGLIALSGILTPLMILGIMFLCIRTLLFRDVSAFAPSARLPGAPVFSGLIYASYNLICAISILASLGKEVKNTFTAIWAAVISTITLTVIAAFMWATISIYSGRISLGEVPMFTLAVRQGMASAWIYGAVLYMAMLTTAVANGFCVLGAINSKIGIKKWQAISLLCAFALPMALFKFSDMVRNLYTLFGVAGFILMVLVIKDGIKLLARNLVLRGK